MKKLLKFFMSIVVIIIILIFAIIDNTAEVPYEAYQDTNYNDQLISQLKNTVDEEIVEFKFNQEMVNSIVYEKALLKINDKYLADNCNTAECENLLVIEQSFGSLKIKGAYLEFVDNLILIKIPAEVDSVFDLNTALTVYIETVVDNGSYSLVLDKVKLGKLPIPKLLIYEFLSSYGVDTTLFNEDTIELNTENLIKVFSKGKNNQSEKNERFAALLRFIKENELFKLGIENEELTLEVNRYKFKSDAKSPEYLTNFDKDIFIENFMVDKILSIIADFQNSPDVSMEVTEEEFNKILFSLATENLNEKLVDSPYGEISGIFVNFLEDSMKVNLAVTILEQPTIIELDTVVSSDGTLTLDFVSGNIGKDLWEEPTDYLNLTREKIISLTEGLGFEIGETGIVVNDNTVNISKKVIESLIGEEFLNNGIAISGLDYQNSKLMINLHLG